jgi:transcriptional regulator with XRE-family HTH domain
MVDELMPLAETLKTLRQAAGMTQMDLAMASKLSLGAVTQIEQGKNKNPRMDTLKALAAALKVSMDKLTADDPPLATQRRRKKGK